MTPHDLNKELLHRREAIRQGSNPKAVERQHARGKQTARERIDSLLDAGSFEEVDPYITHRHSAFGLEEKRFPGDAVVVGFGRIDGRKVAIAAQDFTVIGGSFSEAQAQKVCKVLDLAISAGTPFVSLNDSVGARIQEGVWSLAGYSELFWRNTQASGVISDRNGVLSESRHPSGKPPVNSDNPRGLSLLSETRLNGCAFSARKGLES